MLIERKMQVPAMRRQEILIYRSNLILAKAIYSQLQKQYKTLNKKIHDYVPNHFAATNNPGFYSIQSESYSLQTIGQLSEET